MNSIIDLKAYQKSLYKMFGQLPFRMIGLCILGAYLFGILKSLQNPSDLAKAASLISLPDAFFSGILTAIIIFYVARFTADSAIKKAGEMTERQEDGRFLLCMSHKKLFDLSYGYIIIKSDRLYFEPNRPFGGDLTFDYKTYDHLTVRLGRANESFGLWLLTTEKYMIEFVDQAGQVVGRFIIPEAESHLPTLLAALHK